MPPTAADVKASWYDVSKVDESNAKLLSALEAELKADVATARSTLASAYGSKPVKFIIPINWSAVNNAANQSTTVFQVDMSASPEWTSLVALFDEYRFRGGVLKFSTMCGPLNPVVIGADLCFVLAYDPEDSTVLTSVRDGIQVKEHKLFASTTYYGGAGGATFSQAFYAPLAGQPFEFRFRPPAGSNIGISNTGTVVQDAGVWKSVNYVQTNAAEGWIKPYFVNGSANGAIVAGGNIYYEIELRYRE
jgi:hypothetical protein